MKKLHKKLPVVIYIGAALSLMLVVVIGGISLHFSESQKNKEKWVEHTYDVLAQVHDLDWHLYELAMYKQRYKVSGLDSFRQYFQFQADSLRLGTDKLKVLVGDNPMQTANINLLQHKEAQLLSFWQNKKADIFNTPSASIIRFSWAEKAKLDSVALQIAVISNVERKLLIQRGHGSVALRKRTETSIVAGTLLILAMVAFLVYFIITELKNRMDAYRNEKELNQAKTSFITLASHEFRTPLSSVLLSASLIEKYLESADPGQILKHCEKIRKTVANMNGVLEDFLSLEKLDAGKVQAKLASFDLVALGEDIAEEMQDVLRPSQTLNFQHEGDARMVHLDESLLRNAIINLVANAVKYAGEKAQIAIKTKIDETGVTIKVTDNGKGIDAPNHKNIFTPFFRVDHTGNIPGSGLGLDIVARYVKLMNGTVSFTSIPFKETCFDMKFDSLAVTQKALSAK